MTEGPAKSPHDGVIRILLLEDSDIDAELMAAHLRKAGLSFDIRRVITRREFVTALEENDCDIIIADYSLPQFDGLSALTIARALRPERPFVFVSGIVGEDFATNALKRGATDYVTKRNLSRLPTAIERSMDQAFERAERRRAEEALRQSEISARIAADAAQLGLWDYHPLTGVLNWDERCKAMYGLSPSAPISMETFLLGCHPDDRERMQREVQEAITWTGSDKPAFQSDFRIVTPEGRERWVASRGQAHFVDGQCQRFAGVLRDVTEERRTASALQDLARMLEQQVAARTAERDQIWRLSVDLFVVIDRVGRILSLNPAWSQMLGLDPATQIGVRFTTLLHADAKAAAIDMFDRLAMGERIERFETQLRHANGSFRWITWTIAPGGDAYYAVGRDTTHEREAARAIAERNRELAAQIEGRQRAEQTLRQMQRLEAVGQLTSGVAHDFNNLLTVILGNVGFIERMVSRAGLETQIGPRISHVRTAAERGAKLTAQLLAFSRRQKLEPKPVDLNDTVSGMRELLEGTMGGSIRIETTLKPDLWPALVDPTQIELIILNLAINARDAMEVGGALTVETGNVTLRDEPSRLEEPAPGDYVMLAVSDTGTGMTPEVLAKAFEPFFTTKEVGKGSGLGLAQVYGFAKQSGGGARIETRVGEGTTVKVFLPRATEVGLVASDAPPAPRAVDCGGTVDHCILLVDDDSAVREVTAAMLADLGYNVKEAGSGGMALDLLRGALSPDLLLVDYAMPGMNGAEVAEAAMAIRPGLPVLFMTGYADLEAIRHIAEDAIIRKPFQDEELARKVAQILRETDRTNVVSLRRG